MTRITLFVAALLCAAMSAFTAPGQANALHAAICGAAPQPTWGGGPYQMVFSDGFGGTVLKSANWTPGWFGTGKTGPVNDLETAAYNQSHVTLSGGMLHLKLTNEPITVGGHTYPHTGALISSNGKFNHGPMAIEWRAFMPASGSKVANWPALWSDGQNWPQDGELDIMEGLGGDASFHFHSSSTGAGGYPSGNWTGWHNFGADWQSGKVRYFWDGRLVGTLSQGITSAPQYLIADYTTESDSPLQLPATMLVDHVRAWVHC